MRRIVAVALILSACTRPPAISTMPHALTGAGWAMTTLVAPNTTDRIGADSANLGLHAGKISACTAWEQGGAQTAAALDGTTTNPTTGANAHGEDSICVVLGNDEVEIGAGQGIHKIKIQGTGWSVVLDATHGNGVPNQAWMQLGYADMNGDTIPDILAGGRDDTAPVTSTFGYLTWVSDYKIAGNWTWHEIGPVGYTMAIKPIDFDGDGDQDVFLTDRLGAAGVGANKGVWWYEAAIGPTLIWTPHQIAAITGDPSFGDAIDTNADGAVDLVAAGNRTTLTIYTLVNGAWSASSNRKPVGTGDVHGVRFCDMNTDGTADLLTTYALTAVGDSWIGWLEQDGTYQDIGGAADVERKPDQPACYDIDGDGNLDAITAEGGNAVKTDDLGVVWFKNPRSESCTCP